MHTSDPRPPFTLLAAHPHDVDHHPTRRRVPLQRLAVSCPRCGARPAVRVTPALVEMLSNEPAELHLVTYQCHRQKCNHVYDITAGAYQRAS